MALSVRIMSLSEDLSRQQRLLTRHQHFIEELRVEIERYCMQSDTLYQLSAWVDEAIASIATDDGTIDHPTRKF